MKHPPIKKKAANSQSISNAGQSIPVQQKAASHPPALQLKQPGNTTGGQKAIQKKRRHRAVGGVGTSAAETKTRQAEIDARLPGLRKELYAKMPASLSGEIYFKGAGKCTVSAGEIKQGKTNLGKIEIEKDASTKEVKLNYNYTFGEKTYQGDLLSDAFGATHEETVHHNEFKPGETGKKKYGDIKKETITTLPGEGSYLKLKSKNEMIYGPGGWIVMKLHKQGKKDDGYHKYGGGKTLDVLVDHFGPDDGFSFEDLKMLDYMSQVETGGQIQGLNSYDSEYMSIGFAQFTMGGKIQKWFEKNRSAFSKYGIGKMVGPNKKTGFKKHGKQYQSRFWSARYYEAGLDKEIIRSQITLLQELDKKKFKKLKDNGITHSALKASLLELANNRPVFFDPAIKGIKAEKIITTKDGKQSFDGAKLKRMLGDLYKYMEIFVGGNLSVAVKKTKDKDDLIKTKSDLKSELGISKQYAYGNIATIKSKISSNTKVKATYAAFWKHIKHEQKGFNMYQKVYNRFKNDISSQKAKFEAKGKAKPAAGPAKPATTATPSAPTTSPSAPTKTSALPSPMSPAHTGMAAMASATPFPFVSAPMISAMASQEQLNAQKEQPASQDNMPNSFKAFMAILNKLLNGRA